MSDPNSSYRPDIDGLRAIAVVPVVLYHAGVPGFSGGFVGVDIFFVISGFLITGILVREASEGRLSILNFYRRRALRILPALFAMLFVVAVIASWSMLPVEVATFSRSMSAAALFVSNIQFYLDTDYFASGSNVKPLLHTWSLAIEEQWYILWPLLILWLGRNRPRIALITVAVCFGSFVTSVWQTAQNMPAAFYLLPSRAWELGIGAMLAVHGRPVRNKPPLAAVMGFAGLLLILASIKFYTHETRFPGFAALAPCIGAALLIYSGSQRTWVSRILSIRPARFVGQISYSLYLWHWPVIVFGQIVFFRGPGTGMSSAEIALSFVLAYLSWRFIERPFRSNITVGSKQVLQISALAITAMVGISLFVPTLSKIQMHFTPQQTAIAKWAELDPDSLYRRGTCFAVGAHSEYDREQCLQVTNGRPTIVFMGDSHAAALWPGLSTYSHRFNVIQATATGCAPKLYDRPEKSNCEKVMNLVLRDWIIDHKPSAILFASRWKPGNIQGLETTLQDPLVKSANPILIGPIPEYSVSLPRILVFADRESDPSLIDRSRSIDVKAIDEQLRDIARRTNTPYISLESLLCSDGHCITRTPDGAPLQIDSSHMSSEGSKEVVDAIMPQIEALIARPASRVAN